MLKSCSNLLLQVLRIDLSTSKIDMHSSVARPSRADSSLIILTPSARSTGATNQDVSIRATFIDAPFTSKVTYLIPVNGCCERSWLGEYSIMQIVSASILPSFKAIWKPVTSSGAANRPDCSDLSVGLERSNGSGSNSTMHTGSSWTAYSSLFILADCHSSCFLWRLWQLRFFLRAALTLATLFAFPIVEKNVSHSAEAGVILV